MKIIKILYVLDEEDKKSIKKQMIDLDLTLQKLGSILGVSYGRLSEIINGKRYLTQKVRSQFESLGIVFKGDIL